MPKKTVPKKLTTKLTTEYVDKRQKLNETGTFYRVKRSDPYFFQLVPRNESGYKNQAPLSKKVKGQWVDDEEKIKERRMRQYDNLKASSFDKKQFVEFVGIHQRSEGACSFVAFLHLLKSANFTKTYQLTEADLYTNEDIFVYWADIWDKMLPYGDPNHGMIDIAHMLDAAVNIGFIDEKLKQHIEYVPIRSSGHAEWKINPTLLENNEENPIKQIEKFLKNLIDQKIRFIVNVHEHTRLCIGYTEKEYVFADSWGRDVVQSEYDLNKERVNHIEAGYSYVPFGLVNSYVRDIAYWKELKKDREESSIAKKLLSFYT